ncbi:Copper Transporter integral membrane protein that functions in high affinity copper transport [Exserohilum turcicum]
MSSSAPMTSPSSSMGGMGMGMGNGCKISMLWNWNVIDTCFISSSWHVRSRAMFAGSCIGVILLVVLLEFLRRAAKEYDRFLVTQYSKTLVSATNTSSSASSSNGAATNKQPETTERATSGMAGASRAKFRPSIMQQAVRALLHTCAFAVAYFVMLLAMYYNGYFIICIFIGAYIGYFVFGWESFSVSGGGEDRMQEDATVCCG